MTRAHLEKKEKNHTFDIRSGFCLRCGRTLDDVEKFQLPCPGAPNVIAISHIVTAPIISSTKGSGGTSGGEAA